ncbi:hypothetical protein LDENG_00216460 [Lucifuga dentata]|nr:hypothetical protein LDENG_00216460 [Lucifuga dentata]
MSSARGPRLNLARLLDQAVCDEFAHSLAGGFTGLDAMDDPNVMWETYHYTTLKVARECVGFACVSRRKSFISESTLDIIERSRSARLGGNSRLYRELKRRTAKALRADKEALAREICEQVTHHLWSSDPHPAYRGIEELRSSKPAPCATAVLAANGSVLTDDSAILTRWAGYFEQLYKADPPARMLDIAGAVVLTPDPPIDCDPHSLSEIARLVKQLRAGQAAGICGIPAEPLQVQPVTSLIRPGPSSRESPSIAWRNPWGYQPWIDLLAQGRLPAALGFSD